MTEPTHIFILVLSASVSVIGYFVIMFAHELRAMGRDKAAKERHEFIVKDLANNRALTLAAIQHRIAIEHDVGSIKATLVKLEERIEELEEHCSDNSPGR